MIKKLLKTRANLEYSFVFADKALNFILQPSSQPLSQFKPDDVTFYNIHVHVFDSSELLSTCKNQQINMLLLSKTNIILIDIFSSFEVQNTQHRLHQKSISLKIVSNLCTLIWISRSHIEILMLSRQVQGV